MEYTRIAQSPEHMRSRFDAVVIGSGYGGGVSALRLAEAGMDVAVLERGREIPVGEFPDSLTAGVRDFQSSGKTGHVGSDDALFELRIGEGISAFIGCGVGGTSLINGNVMLEPEDEVFEQPEWPAAIRKDRAVGLAAAYERARRMLGPARYPGQPTLLKVDAFDQAAMHLGEQRTFPPISVTFEDQAGENAAGVSQPPCTRCGDCCSGCNVGAKNTVALNYLPAAVRAGAKIFANCRVERLERAETGWRIIYRRTGEGATEDDFVVEAGMVVCSAGTLGSSELLLRCLGAGLPLSRKLGRGFSSNGDVIAFAYNNDVAINAIGVGHPPQAETEPVGPVIAGLIDMRGRGPLDERIVIQEGTLPSLLAPLLPSMLSGAAPLFGDKTEIGHFFEHSKRALKSLAMGSYTGAVRNTQVFLVMGHDGSDGEMVMTDGKLSLRWPEAGGRHVFEHVDKVLEAVTAATHGTYIANPIWSKALGRNLVTVHPLGGCGMGEDIDTGVTDHCGRVFDPAGGAHEGLYVLDASIIPRSLGVNPGLTIAALAERAMANILGGESATLA